MVVKVYCFLTMKQEFSSLNQSQSRKGEKVQQSMHLGELKGPKIVRTDRKSTVNN